MYNQLFLALFIRRILVAWNAIKTIDNEIINLIMLIIYCLNCFDATEIRGIGQVSGIWEAVLWMLWVVMPSMKQFRKIMRKKYKNNIQTVKACTIYEKVYACMESTNSYKMFA